MNSSIKKPALFLAFCIIMLNGIARPLENKGFGSYPPENDPVTVGPNSYEYPYDLSDLNGKPAAIAIPAAFQGSTYSVSEGITGYAATQLKAKWYSDMYTRNRLPITPGVCIDMGEHYFIAQFYYSAPGQNCAMVIGQDGYFYNVQSFFCEMLSSQEYKCWGLPISDTKKHTIDDMNYYTINVQTDPCYGSLKTTLYYFPSGVIPPSLKSVVSLAGSCGVGDIYSKDRP